MTDDIRELARAAGLDKLTDEHLAQLARAAAGMRRHIERLPKDLPVSDEPAHVFQAKAHAQ
jgi:hypothetical protein